METRENILMYAGYSAFIISNALTECGGFPAEMVGIEKESRDLSATRCRWLIREFNNNEANPGIANKWKKMMSSLNNKLRVKVSDFNEIVWDEKQVLLHYQNLRESRKLISVFVDAVFSYNMDLKECASYFNLTKNKLWGFIRYDIWIPEALLKAIRRSLPSDEGFPGRFQLLSGKEIL